MTSATAAILAITQGGRHQRNTSAGTPPVAFPLAIAASSRPAEMLSEQRQQKQGQLLSALRTALASALIVDSAAFTALCRLLTEDGGDNDGTVQGVLQILLACFAATPAFCEAGMAVDAHEVYSTTSLVLIPSPFHLSPSFPLSQRGIPKSNTVPFLTLVDIYFHLPSSSDTHIHYILPFITLPKPTHPPPPPHALSPTLNPILQPSPSSTPMCRLFHGHGTTTFIGTEKYELLTTDHPEPCIRVLLDPDGDGRRPPRPTGTPDTSSPRPRPCVVLPYAPCCSAAQFAGSAGASYRSTGAACQGTHPKSAYLEAADIEAD